MIQYYAASPSQKRIYIASQMGNTETSYNLSWVSIINGRLNIEKLEDAFSTLVSRHESLRTYFELVDGELYQCISDYNKFEICYREIESFNISNEHETMEAIIQDFIKPFSLSDSKLFRVGLYKLYDNKHMLIIDMHHIIADGVSLSIILNEFSQLYQGNILSNQDIQYKDFSAWQSQMLQTKYMKNQEQYWCNILSGEILVLNLPIDYPRTSERSYEGDIANFKIDEVTTSNIKKVLVHHRVTMFMFLIAVYDVLLSRYSNQDDVIVGVPAAGRVHSEFSNIVGVFVNTLAIRNYPKADVSFGEFIRRVKENSLEAFENQEYPFEAIIEKLNVKRDSSRNPLFDASFAMQNINVDIQIEGLDINTYEFTKKISKFDLTLYAFEKNGEVNLSFEFNTALFKKSSIENMAKHYLNIVKTVLEDTEVLLGDIEILTEFERNQICVAFNNTAVPYLKQKTIYQLFEEQVDRSPNNTAVMSDKETLTYFELNSKANSLARNLREKGVGRNSIVGIMIDRSCDMMVGILAILKAGGAYLPINPRYPKDRINFILDDSNTSLLLVQEEFFNVIDSGDRVLNIEDEKLYELSGENLNTENSSKDLAYIIYTSGSTGIPKGVMIEHQSLNNRLKWMCKKYSLGENDIIMQKTPYTFDVSVWELFLWMYSGASMYFLTPEAEKDPSKIVEAIEKRRITIMHFVPSMLQSFMDYIDENTDMSKLSTLKEVFSSGEALRANLVNRFNKFFNNNGTRLHNLYGPTEATIDVTYYDCSGSKEFSVIPIGKPIDNTKLYILNKNLKLQPVGIPGELFIAGDGVARGYLKRDELTSEKFVDNLFSAGEKMYKTGDLVRWMLDGNIEFLGRLDYQVKIRGFRIELGEIEAKLVQHQHIKEAVVIDRENSLGEKCLCAYIIITKQLTIPELKEYLRDSLPEYMIPDYFVEVEELPLMQNGKLDRNALLKLDSNIDIGVKHADPTNEIERLMLLLWQDILSVKVIGINDNFFDLGGNSLKVITLTSRINKDLKVQLQVADVFKRPTIIELADFVSQLSRKEYAAISSVDIREHYPLTYAQKRMYLLNKLESSALNYNMPRAMIISGKLDVYKLNKAFNLLVNRHGILRTGFEIIDGEIVQRINEHIDFNMDITEEDNVINNKDEAELVNDIIKEFIKPFDLKSAPLIRAKLVMLGKKKYLLVIDLHHIVFDGMSLSIFMREIQQIYNGNNLDDLQIQYKDYAVWQNELYKSNAFKEQEAYWLNIYCDEVPVLNLPTDYIRPPHQSFAGDKFIFELDEVFSEELNTVSKRHKCTLFTVLISVYSILLSKYSGQEDIIIGTTTSGRNHADLENIIGVFINTLALRMHPRGDLSFAEYLDTTLRSSLAAFDNQDIQFDYLVNKLNANRDLSRNPLFDTMFVLHNMDIGKLDLDQVDIKSVDISTNTSKCDILMQAIPQNQKLFFEVEYCVDLFKRETIEQFAEHFISILKAVIKNDNIKIEDIDILTKEEKHKLLHEFNNSCSDIEINKTIHEIFEEQTKKTPDNVAVVSEQGELTYRMLNEKSNCVARKLIDIGIERNCIVGIMAGRSMDIIIGILGIMKTGGGYLPISPDYPSSRIEYILRDSNAKALLTNEDFTEGIEFYGSIINLKDDIIYELNSTNIDGVHSLPEDIAYVIYTSGTTGAPKGVMIEHRSVVNLALSQIDRFRISEEEHILQFSPISFDASAEQIFIALLSGASIFLVSKSILLDNKKFEAFLIDSKITHLNAVPAFLDNLGIKGSHSLKRIVSGGDVCSKSLAQKWYRDCEFYNQYGPTETTVTSTSYLAIDIEENQSQLPIGKPIQNTSIYILDTKKNLLPVGVIGEVYISGIGLAKGYLNNPELTSERFVQNPFIIGERMYKTGDLAKWRSDGNIEYVGRVDSQVKIRGYRIEINEIEIHIRNIVGIKDALVVDRENYEGYKALCAYVVIEGKLTIPEIREKLMMRLPEYMIPSYFIQVDNISLLHSGKVDKASLPHFDLVSDSSEEYVPPTNELEDRIAKIWRKVLNVNTVGIYNDFFDLGGNSLSAVKLQVELEKNKIETSLRDIYSYRTIKEYANFVSGRLVSNVDKDKPEPSAKIEDLVEPELEEGIIIKNIEPFNELFYRNCFFNLAMAVISHYRCNIATLLVNDVQYYIYQKNNVNSIGTEYISNKSIESVMETERISINIKEKCGDIANEIIVALRKQRPVIICVDSYFYETVITSKTEKSHWLHYLLVYGYDDKKKIFHIIEQRYQEKLSYEKREISYYDLVNSYNGYFTNSEASLQETSYYEFYIEDSSKINCLEELVHSNIRNRKVFLENIITNQYQIIEGVDKLLEFKQDLEEVYNHQESLDAYIENLVEGLNKITNAKKVEEYKLKNLFGDRNDILEHIGTIIENWTSLRAILAKYMYSKVFIKAQIAEKLTNIGAVHEQEHKIIECLTKIYESLD